jgi:hypothetical protein
MKSESVVMRNYDNLHVEPKLVNVGVAMKTVKSSAFELGRRKRLLHFLSSLNWLDCLCVSTILRR